MVNIVDIADTLAEVQEVGNGCENIIQGDVIRDELLDALCAYGLEIRGIRIVQNIAQNADGNELLDADVLRIEVHIACEIDHAVAEHLDLLLDHADLALTVLIGIVLLGFNVQECLEYTSLLNGICLVKGQDLASLCNDLTGHRICHRTGQGSAGQTGCNAELLVVLVSAELAEIVSSRIEEQHVEMALCALDCGRLAGTELLVGLHQTVVDRLGGILLEDRLVQALVMAEHLLDLLIGAQTDCTEEGGQRDLAVLIDADVNDIVGVHLVFEPRAAVRDDGGLEQLLTGLVLLHIVVNAGGTHELGYDRTLCAVDNEGTAFGHEREIAHEDLALLDFAGLLVPELGGDAQGRSVGDLVFLCLRDGLVLEMLVIEAVAGEGQYEIAVVIGSREILENFPETGFPEFRVGVLLDLDQVRHFLDFLDLAEAHSDVLAELLGSYIYHRRIPPCII